MRSPIFRWCAALAGFCAVFPQAGGALNDNSFSTVEFDGKKAGFPELKAPANARLTKDWKRQYRGWAEKTIAQPFGRQCEGKPWGPLAAAFVGHSLDAWHMGEDPSIRSELGEPALGRPDLAAAGKAVLATECREPLVRFFAAYWDWLNSTSYQERKHMILPDSGYALQDGLAAVDRMRGAGEDLAAAGGMKVRCCFLRGRSRALSTTSGIRTGPSPGERRSSNGCRRRGATEASARTTARFLRG